MGISLSAAEKLMKKYGAERVSDEAKKEMVKILEEYLFEVSLKASRVSQHGNRKTISEGDLVIASQ